jgi:hypothetical protein
MASSMNESSARRSGHYDDTTQSPARRRKSGESIIAEGESDDDGNESDESLEVETISLQDTPINSNNGRARGGSGSGANLVSKGPSYVHMTQPNGGRTDHVQCLIVREKTNSFLPFAGKSKKSSTCYQLILEETKKVLIVARKMKMNRTSNYHMFDMTRGVATSSLNLNKKSGNYLGKLRATNMNRTEYVLMTKNAVKEQVCEIQYERAGIMNHLKEGSQPRKMTVILPKLDTDSTPIPRLQGDDQSLSYTFMSKEPVYEKGNYRLNFKGRVSVPSVKNFQLVSPDAIGDVICQFGKIGDDRFHLDFKAPFNPFQAFSLALSQFNL